ncbi:MAG: TatD DNase family protein [Limisphaerales bacterium]|jgi:TatD DNase family protein
MYIDTHAHLYHGKFDNDRAEMLRRALDAGVEKYYLPNIDSTSIEAMMKMVEKDPQRCFPMMGVHPCSIKDDFENELNIAKEWLFNSTYKETFYGVGEIGLDYHWDTTFKQEQIQAYKTQISWAKELELPIIIHSRDSLDDTIGIIEEEAGNGLRGIFHCFNGTAEQAQRIIGTGFLMGIGGVATFKNGGQDKIIPDIALKHLVLETDAPYLSPVPHRGKRNESSYVPLIAAKLSEWYGLSAVEIGKITSENAIGLFHKKHSNS